MTENTAAGPATSNEVKFCVEFCLRSDLTVLIPLWLGSVQFDADEIGAVVLDPNRMLGQSRDQFFISGLKR